jgi:hypothetical protein
MLHSSLKEGAADPDNPSPKFKAPVRQLDRRVTQQRYTYFSMEAKINPGLVSSQALSGPQGTEQQSVVSAGHLLRRQWEYQLPVICLPGHGRGYTQSMLSQRRFLHLRGSGAGEVNYA